MGKPDNYWNRNSLWQLSTASICKAIFLLAEIIVFADSEAARLDQALIVIPVFLIFYLMKPVI